MKHFFWCVLLAGFGFVLGAQDLYHLKIKGTVNGISFDGFDLLCSDKITERVLEMLHEAYPRKDFSAVHQGFLLGNGHSSVAYLSTQDAFDFKSPQGSNALLRVMFTKDPRFQDARIWLAGTATGLTMMIFFQPNSSDDQPEALNGRLTCWFNGSPEPEEDPGEPAQSPQTTLMDQG